jgi:regulator of protease activity HflC (stomatin/prohibitin superfamily)
VANLIVILIIVAAALLIGLFMSVRIVKQYEDGVLFPLGRVGVERASPAA